MSEDHPLINSEPQMPDPNLPTPSLQNNDFEVPTLSNLYKFGLIEGDRDRLIAQSHLFTQYLREKAKTFINTPIKRVLDLGCGEGQLTIILGKVFPNAEVIGMDNDENAIAAAGKKLGKMTSPPINVEYIVGDAQEQLAQGSYDLIYASLVLAYLPNPDHTLRLIFETLTPGGYVWIKDGHPDWIRAIEHPAYYRLGELAADTLIKMGAHPTLGGELPKMLANLGFTEIGAEEEVYPMTNLTLPGRIAISMVLGWLYNFRTVIARIQHLPEAEIISLHKELSDNIPDLKGHWKLANLLARRPLE